LLKAKYTEAGALLAVLGLRLFFINFGTAKTAFIMTENLLRYSLVTAIVGSVVNVTLNLLLIPHFKAFGSICSMMVSFSFTIFLIDFFYPPVRRNLREMLRAIVTPWRISFD
jgi:O-antigen/teichoic acid export membrane protein